MKHIWNMLEEGVKSMCGPLHNHQDLKDMLQTLCGAWKDNTHWELWGTYDDI